MDGHGCVLIKLYLQNQVEGQIWPITPHLLTSCSGLGCGVRLLGFKSSLCPLLAVQTCLSYKISLCLTPVISVMEITLLTRGCCADTCIVSEQCWAHSKLSGLALVLFSAGTFWRAITSLMWLNPQWLARMMINPTDYPSSHKIMIELRLCSSGSPGLFLLILWDSNLWDQ